MYSDLADKGERAMKIVLVQLTARETECLRLASQGKTSRAIAAKMRLNRRQVDRSFDSAAEKLGAENRTHAVAEALRRKIIE